MKSTKSHEILRKFELMQFKVIDLGVSWKLICNFILVINNDYGRISYRFQDIDTFSSKIARFPTPPLFDAP